jgi:hypothetical protein
MTANAILLAASGFPNKYSSGLAFSPLAGAVVTLSMLGLRLVILPIRLTLEFCPDLDDDSDDALQEIAQWFELKSDFGSLS